MNSFLRIRSVWEDEPLLEVKILASNGEFSGGADCHTNREAMAELGNSLRGFPRSLDSVVGFTTGEKQDSSLKLATQGVISTAAGWIIF